MDDSPSSETPYCADRDPISHYLCTLPMGHLRRQAKSRRRHAWTVDGKEVHQWDATAGDLLAAETNRNIVGDLYDALTPLAVHLRQLFGRSPIEGGTGNAGSERKVEHLRNAMMAHGEPTWFDLLSYLVAHLGAQRPDDTESLHIDLIHVAALATLWAKQLDEQ